MLTEVETDELFSQTLAGDDDDEATWEAVRKLQTNPSRMVFEKAAEWCRSQDPLYRARGSDILCKLRAPQSAEENATKTLPVTEPVFVFESFQIVSSMVESESDEIALRSELFGLGHLYREEAVPILVSFATHASEEIRYAATWALGCFPQNASAIETLMKLTADQDDDIRDWALFAIGCQSDLDFPELRDTLAQHLDDPFQDAKEEAIAGLAKRKDQRAIIPLLGLMESGSYSSHHSYDFASLVDLEGEGGAWGTDDFIDAVYERFPDHLPPRHTLPAS